MWYVDCYNRNTNTGYGVTISELDHQRHEATRIMARTATYDTGKRLWTFNSGREMWFDPDTGDLIRSVVFDEKPVPYYIEDPALMVLIDQKPNTLSFFELHQIVDYFQSDGNPKVLCYATRYYGLLADTLWPLIILAIAVPLSVSGMRRSPVLGALKSFGLFLFYYLLTTIATALGSNGYLDPMLAAWIPNCAMIGLATILFVRMRSGRGTAVRCGQITGKTAEASGRNLRILIRFQLAKIITPPDDQKTYERKKTSPSSSFPCPAGLEKAELRQPGLAFRDSEPEPGFSRPAGTGLFLTRSGWLPTGGSRFHEANRN